MTDTPAIEVQNLHVGYGATPVLHGIDLAVAPGEFVAILGSSGCGKTTLLRTIAGFQKASAGAIRLSGRDVANLAPEKRDIAMVFQSYALWPHMTVLGNIGYGLRLRGVPRRRGAAAGRRDADAPQPLGPRGAQGHEPLRRPAPARGARPRARDRPAAAAARRAAVEPRRQGARAAAPRDQGAAEPPRLHRDPRHPRPRGGDDHGRPHRGDGCRPHRPGRHAEGGLRPAELALRRELHGRGQHARPRGRAGCLGRRASGPATEPPIAVERRRRRSAR